MYKGFKQGDRVPVLSRKGHENLEITESTLKEMMVRNPIMPKKFKNPDAEDTYSEVPESKYDFPELKKKNKHNLEFHPKQGQNEGHESEEDPEAEEIHNVNKPEKGAQRGRTEGDAQRSRADGGAQRSKTHGGDQRGKDDEDDQHDHEDRNQQMSTPEPGTLEYKRMLENFLQNPEHVKALMQGGADLQNMFPFCSVHNSYGQQLPTHELDPRNYKFLPAKYTQRIAPAGRKTLKSDNLYNLILQ